MRQRGVERTIACDRLAIGYGLVPNIEMGLLFGCATAQEAIQVNRWQETSIADVYAAGECTGFGGSELALVEGEIAGYAAAGASQQAQARFARRARWQRFAAAINRTFQLAESLKNAATPESLLCRGCRRRLAAGQTDPALRNGRLSRAHLRRQRPLAVWLAAAAAERAAVPRPRGNAYCPRQTEYRAVTATLLHHRARQGRQAQ